MKMRTDFVTNSSSTNFIIISKEEVKNEHLVNLLGFKNKSPFFLHIEDLIYDIISKINPAELYFNKSYYKEKFSNLEEFIKEKFSKQTYEKFLKASQKNDHVYIGSFSSEESKFSGFFCTDSILIENDDIYFDAIECGW